MSEYQFLGMPNWVMRSLHRFFSVFTHARSRMIHFYPLNPPTLPLGGAECGFQCPNSQLSRNHNFSQQSTLNNHLARATGIDIKSLLCPGVRSTIIQDFA
ncbi:hypothetical protein QUA41_26390 [Microcoleus sp. Pol11C1]|uniref:hypothetical protein n=1 Tax=unclassified Microcoleus TaxID=2642155 RepID=UPI002FD11F94